MGTPTFHPMLIFFVLEGVKIKVIKRKNEFKNATSKTVYETKITAFGSNSKNHVQRIKELFPFR